MTPALRSSALDGLPGVAHGFFGRSGGVSQGIYASLNCGQGSNDRPEDVAENRARVARAVGVRPDRLLSVHQVHGRVAVTAVAPWDERPKADAMVTAVPGLALGVLAADCTPVLFADPEAGIIGAAHAGWRGALAGVTDATVEAMVGLGASAGRIRAAIGPTIRSQSYEVGPEFPVSFLDDSAENARFFRPAARPGHHMFDLPGYLGQRLRRLGLAAVDDLGQDTLSQPDRYFSYRRTTLDREPDYGRQLSAIALVPTHGITG
jgi:YfiH family protein